MLVVTQIYDWIQPGNVLVLGSSVGSCLWDFSFQESYFPCFFSWWSNKKELKVLDKTRKIFLTLKRSFYLFCSMLFTPCYWVVLSRETAILSSQAWGWGGSWRNTCTIRPLGGAQDLLLCVLTQLPSWAFHTSTCFPHTTLLTDY